MREDSAFKHIQMPFVYLLVLTTLSPRNQEHSREQRRQRCLLYGSFLLANEMAEKTKRMYRHEVLSGRRKPEWNEGAEDSDVLSGRDHKRPHQGNGEKT